MGIKLMKDRHLIVIGGGAAGFFCAVNAARMDSELKVTILEKGNKVLSKVKVSGGGRCNVTHSCGSIDEGIACYPRGKHFLRKAFHGFFVQDTVRWFEDRGVPLKTESDGRIFPQSNSSQSIIDCLVRELNKYEVKIEFQADIKLVEVLGPLNEKRFRIVAADGRSWDADHVQLATGGMTKAGGSDWLRSMGHEVIPPVPSLFTFNIPSHPITDLMGISLPAEVSLTGTKLREVGPLLITHWGLSGPVVLRLSAWGARELNACNYRFGLTVNFLPGQHESGLREWIRAQRISMTSTRISASNPFHLPSRLWDHLLRNSGITDAIRWDSLTSVQERNLILTLCRYEFKADGKTTFKEEFVTAGGIALAGIEPHTMQSRKVPGLYFGGEVIDVDGITGGYNFQHAWTSGWLAARHITGQG